MGVILIVNTGILRNERIKIKIVLRVLCLLGVIRCNRRRRVRWEQRATTGKERKLTTTGKLVGRMRSVAMYSTSSSKNNDNNTGRGEQVTGHYLPGAGTNYGKGKKYRKFYIKLHEKLLKFRRTCQKESTSKFEQPRIEAR